MDCIVTQRGAMMMIWSKVFLVGNGIELHYPVYTCRLLLITGVPVDNCYEVFKLFLKPVKEKHILISTAAIACNEVLKNSSPVITREA